MKCNGIQSEPLSLLSYFLDDRYQRTLFLIYINDITVDIKSNIRIFADDVSLFQIVEANPFTSFDNLQHDLNIISVWAKQWRLRFNPAITKQASKVIFSTKIKPPRFNVQ